MNRRWFPHGPGWFGTLDHAPVGRSLFVERDVMDAVRATIGVHRAERGGMLGGDPVAGRVTEFHYDRNGRTTGGTYSPDHIELSRLLSSEWNPAGIRLCGFVHSHPGRLGRPSAGDLEYAARILETNRELGRLLLPIVFTVPDTGEFRVFGWAVRRTRAGLVLERAEVNVVERAAAGAVTAGAEIAVGHAFDRVVRAYDLELLSKRTVMIVGVGGAAGFAEDLARTGVGRFVLIDPDVIEEPNLATQQTYRRDLGRPKVDALGDRLRDINPAASVVAIHAPVDDIGDAEMGGLFGEDPGTVLLCGFTDSFAAQARVNRLALNCGVASLCAQLYREGRGAEITFTVPGLTRACHRCILSSRYRAYLEEEFTNDVGSAGTPIFATSRVNALKGFVAMAILHHGADNVPPGGRRGGDPGSRWRRLLRRIGNRNLIQLRLDPDIRTALGIGVFDRVLAGADRRRICFDEAVWLPQRPEKSTTRRRACPDCGGTGDLRDAIASYADTREMRR